MTQNSSPSGVTTEWNEVLAALQSAADTVLADPRVDSPLLRAEAMRYVMRLAQFARECHVEDHDPAYPELMKLESPFMQWGWPNPDYVYWIAPIHGDFTYRLHGNRGTSRMFTVETWDGDWYHVGDQTIVDCKVHVMDGSCELEIDQDGTFEIVLSRTREAGNWIPVGEGLGSVLIRECYYDWEAERPAGMHIERVGAQFPAPPTDATRLQSDLWHMCEFLRDAPARLCKGVDLHFSAAPDELVFPGLGGALGTDTGFPQQYYGRGHFELGSEEALIIECRPMDCAFWDFQVGSIFWECWDWHQRQLSVNAHQAWIDADGIVRIVISHRDPGVANWLDTAGHAKGLIGCRWNRPKVPGPPVVPTLRKVPFGRISEELPADTPIVTPSQRSETLRRRSLSIRRRLAAD